MRSCESFKHNSFLFCDKYCDTLDNTCSSWLTFQHRLLTCSANVKLLSIVIPKSFYELLLLIIGPLMLMEVDLYGDKKKWCLVAFALKLLYLTLSWRRPLSYRNQSIDLLRKSMEWFLYDRDLRQERVKPIIYMIRCAIWHHLYNLKNVKNTHGGLNFNF